MPKTMKGASGTGDKKVTDRDWAKKMCLEWHELVTEPMIDGFLNAVWGQEPDCALHSSNEFDLFEYYSGISLGAMIVGQVVVDG